MSAGAALASRLYPGLPVALEWVEGRDVPGDAATPFAGDLAAVAGAVPSRQRSFLLGRLAAYAALRRLGAPSRPLRIGADRAPCWPAGFVGSIAHTDDVAVAVAAPAHAVAALGIDVERARDLEPDMWPTVATERERVWLAAQPPARRGTLALRLFCAKEAVYKAWYPGGQRVLEFEEVDLAVEDATEWVAGRVVVPPAATFHLRFVEHGDYLLASGWR